MNKDYKLYELSDEVLNNILSLSGEEEAVYIDSLIERFYGNIDLDENQYEQLYVAYKSSFILEKFYRNNLEFQKGFQAIYTKTGFIREIVNESFRRFDFEKENLNYSVNS